jgi:lipopolysaccharide transport system ATP-binding protein
MKSVIKVQNLSKRYRLGLKEKQAETLAGQIGNLIKSPWSNFKRLREMSKFGDADESVFWALKDLNFEVKEGEVLGIIGKNGAGKSTLLKILSGITDPTSGRIEIHGRVASLLEVGTGFHPELSGRENIYMNGTILGMSRNEIDSKLDEIIDFSGVEKFIDTTVKFYSSGMKVRLGFSVAAHLEPEILIIDEVLAVGDAEFQKKCLGKMEDVSKNQGRTVLFVSHQMDSVRALCSKSILLSNGELEAIGETSLIIENYLGAYKLGLEKIFSTPESKFIRKVLIDSDALDIGVISLKVEFFSNELINYPVAGFVLYNQLGSPVFGSNPRFHNSGYTSQRTKSGTILAVSEQLNLHSGIYKISVWFGDAKTDFEFHEHVLIFEYISGKKYLQKPSPLSIGSLDPTVSWTCI